MNEEKKEDNTVKILDVMMIMDAKMSRIEGDIKQNKHDIREHMRRTSASERRLDELEGIWEVLKTHLHRVEGIIMLAKWLGAIVVGGLTLLEIINILVSLDFINK